MKMEQAKRYVDLYIKNLDDNIDDERLRKEFSPFGSIICAKVMTDESGKSKGFGFVSFEDPEAAEKAVDEMNGKDINAKVLYVGRAQKKAERQAKRYLEQMKLERMNRYQDVNLYVKNLDNSIDDECLRKEFSPFGSITSVKGWWFQRIWLRTISSLKEATKAIAKINGRKIESKALYVALAQKKEDRKAYLASRYMQQMARMCMQVDQMFQLSGGGVPPIPPSQRPYTLAQMAQVQASPQWPTQLLRPGAQATSAFTDMRTAAAVQQAVHIQEPLTLPMLAAACQQEQKQMLGERLFQLIQPMYPDIAGKITGMLLALDNYELFIMLGHHESLKAKVNECISILQAHLAKKQAAKADTANVKKE